MKAKSKKRLALYFVLYLALVACMDDMLGMTTRGYAEETVSSSDILDDSYAGAAEVLEVDVVPTEEEIEEIVQANWWKNPGELVMADVNDSVNVRSGPSEDAERIGKLYSDCGGYILEYTEGWTRIRDFPGIYGLPVLCLRYEVEWKCGGIQRFPVCRSGSPNQETVSA